MTSSVFNLVMNKLVTLFDLVFWILPPVCFLAALLIALRRHRKDYREFLEPALAEYGLRFVSSEHPGMFKSGPFPKLEIRPVRTWINVLGISGQYSPYRIVTFQDPAGRPHQMWANLEFEGFRLRRIRWRAENEGGLPDSARALLKEEASMGDGMRMVRIGVRVIGLLSLISSFAFLALGASCYNRALNFKKTAVEAQGSVIELKEGTDGSHGGTVYYPVIRFADKAGQDHTLYSSTGSYPPAYAVGDQAPILYDPADPKHAEINSFTGLWLLPIIFGVIGGMDLLTALFLLFVLPRILAWAERRTARSTAGPG